MVIAQLDVISGILTILTIIIGTIVGLLIMSRYLKYKHISLIYWGSTVIILVCFLYAAAVSFILALNTGKGLPIGTYVFLATWSSPVMTIFLMASFTELVYKKRQKQLVLIVSIITILVEVYIIYYCIVDPTVLGEMMGIIDITLKGFIRIYFILAIVYILIIAILFTRESLKSDKPETRFKGKTIFIAFIFYVIGAVFDSALATNIFTLLLTRSLFITCMILFYIGFITPNWIKKRFEI